MLILLTHLSVVVGISTHGSLAVPLINGEDCVTPNGEAAKCIPIVSCVVLLQALQTKDREAHEFVRASVCGFDRKKPLVCCGTSSVPDENPVDKTIDEYYKMINSTVDVERDNAVYFEDDNPDVFPHAYDVVRHQDRSLCGIQQHESFGGDRSEADLHEYPWTVAIEYKDKKAESDLSVKCGGVMLNHRYILTAASCLTDRDDIPVSVRLGEWNINSDPDCIRVGRNRMCATPVVKINILKTIPHPSFIKSTDSNDIGLIRLDKNITCNDFIRPICLPTQNLLAPDRKVTMRISGWSTGQNDIMLGAKTRNQISYVKLEECRYIYQDKINLFRACGLKAQPNICSDNLGGPVMRKYKKKSDGRTQWYLEGILAKECSTDARHVMYTRITRYMKWITDTISE